MTADAEPDAPRPSSQPSERGAGGPAGSGAGGPGPPCERPAPDGDEARRREAMADLARRADRIVNLILHSDLPRIDIDIQIENFRAECLRRYPDGEALFEMIYASRFRRIWEQWGRERPGGEASLP